MKNSLELIVSKRKKYLSLRGKRIKEPLKLAIRNGRALVRKPLHFGRKMGQLILASDSALVVQMKITKIIGKKLHLPKNKKIIKIKSLKKRLKKKIKTKMLIKKIASKRKRTRIKRLINMQKRRLQFGVVFSSIHYFILLNLFRKYQMVK